MIQSVLRKIVVSVKQRMHQRAQEWRQGDQVEDGFVCPEEKPPRESAVSRSERYSGDRMARTQ